MISCFHGTYLRPMKNRLFYEDVDGLKCLGTPGLQGVLGPLVYRVFGDPWSTGCLRTPGLQGVWGPLVYRVFGDPWSTGCLRTPGLQGCLRTPGLQGV